MLDSSDDFLDAELREVFRQANEQLRRQVGRGSAYLLDGELGGESEQFLARATPIACYDKKNEDGELYWPPETVQKAHNLAEWRFSDEDAADVFADQNLLHFWETRLFLEVCARHGLGIWFTW